MPGRSLPPSPKLGQGHLLYGVEAYHHDGPWENPDDYQKFNGLLTYSLGDAANGASVTFRGYHGKWDSSDQVAASAVHDGLVPFFGSLDDTTGGDSQRYSLQAEWHRADAESATEITAYGFYSDLDLFSNFTYFLTDTQRGDQFEQTDKRWVGGLKASHTLFNAWWNKEVEHVWTPGSQRRHRERALPDSGPSTGRQDQRRGRAAFCPPPRARTTSSKPVPASSTRIRSSGRRSSAPWLSAGRPVPLRRRCQSSAQLRRALGRDRQSET